MSRLSLSQSIATRLAACAVLLSGAIAPAVAAAEARADRTLPAATSVDRLTFSASALTGVQGTYSDTMALGSATLPLTGRTSAQLDFGFGSYREAYGSYVVAGRLFRRYGSQAALAVYLDYANVNPEHAGRFGIEGAYHWDRVTIEALIGMRTGTNVYSRPFDEIDVTYYVTDDFKASVGHRGTTRGHVGNVSFEFAPRAMGGWTVFGEAEVGEDDNHSAFAGLRYTFGEGRYASLIERDRAGPMRIRAPRGLVDVTRCGKLPDKQSATFGFREMSVLCASKDELDEEGAEEGKKR